MTATFYSSLPVLDDFHNLDDDQYFQNAPLDYRVVIADIKNSTQAIEQGRYKEVNFIGAAVIALLSNTLNTREFPFVFGGDGASILLSPEQWSASKEELAKLKSLSLRQFGLELRVGLISVEEIQKRSEFTVKVAKLKMVGQSTLALFRGGGIQFADQLIKSESQFELNEEVVGQPDLTNLSCRWRPVPNQRGVMLSLIVLAKGDDSFYSKCVQEIEMILNSDLKLHNPVYHEGMSYLNIFQMKNIEQKAGNHLRKTSFHYLIGRLISYFLFSFKAFKLFEKSKVYIDELGEHSDFRKFDDALRLTIDCSIDQKDQILKFLEGAQKNGKIFFGSHCSNEALMTCFVPEMTSGNHIHFIDGGSGGYALAAKQLKAQLNSYKKPTY